MSSSGNSAARRRRGAAPAAHPPTQPSGQGQGQGPSRVNPMQIMIQHEQRLRALEKPSESMVMVNPAEPVRSAFPDLTPLQRDLNMLKTSMSSVARISVVDAMKMDNVALRKEVEELKVVTQTYPTALSSLHKEVDALKQITQSYVPVDITHLTTEMALLNTTIQAIKDSMIVPAPVPKSVPKSVPPSTNVSFVDNKPAPQPTGDKTMVDGYSGTWA